MKNISEKEKKSKKRNLSWVAPFIGGALSLIALATPAWYINESDSNIEEYIYVWMWGFQMSTYINGTGIRYTGSYTWALGFSIICSVLVMICAIMLIFLAIKNRIGKEEFIKVKRSWYLLSILLIIIESVWNLLVPNWYGLFPGFGVIGIYLGAFITLIGTKAIDRYRDSST